MTSYEFEHSEITTASPADVFALWADVTSWPSWDSSVKLVELAGPFAAGTTGSMDIEGQGAIPFTITEVVADARFADVTEVNGLVIRFIHTVTATEGGAKVTHRVEIDGPAEVTAQVGPMITGDTPDAVKALAALAAERAGARTAS